MTETVVHLKPASAWRPGMTREKLLGELDAAVTLPGVANIWTQPIINRIKHADHRHPLRGRSEIVWT
jgi:Cu(I)/Ag(I) efflux system membrane protein CusA/SilA